MTCRVTVSWNSGKRTRFVYPKVSSNRQRMLHFCYQMNNACSNMDDCKLPINQQNGYCTMGMVPPPPHRRRYSQDSFSSSGNSTLEQEDFHFMESSHPLQVLTGLNSLRGSGVFCDVTICVENEEFQCHRIVLASFSPYFKAMFTGELMESQQGRVELKGVEAPMIKLLIDYAYTSEIIITKGNVQSLLSAANLLEILPVRDACCHFMERNMDETNSLGIHCFAEAHGCSDLQSKAKEFTLKYFMDVVRQEEFLNLSELKLIEFLESDELEAEQEEDVFNAVIAWLDHKLLERSETFHNVLEHVRLPLVSTYFLHDQVQLHPVIKSSTECQTLVDEAKTFHLLSDRRQQLLSSRTRSRNSFGMIEVIVAVGGEDDKVVLRSMESFNPRTHRWLTHACLPFAVSKHGLVVSGMSTLYMAGGEFPDGSVSRSMWRYDPVFDAWHEMSCMNIGRSELGLALVDGYIYAVGGWEGSARLDSVERYDPRTNSWTFVSPLKMAVTSPAVATYNGFLFVTGGAVLEDGDGIDLVQCYDPKADKWSLMAPMLIPRSGSAACVLNNLIYVIGGWHASTENTNKVECYDPVKNEWTVKASMNERRYRPGAAVVDGKIYVCGGEEGWDRYHDTIERYNEENDVWEFFAEMPTSRSWLSCATLLVHKNALKEKT